MFLSFVSRVAPALSLPALGLAVVVGFRNPPGADRAAGPDPSHQRRLRFQRDILLATGHRDPGVDDISRRSRQRAGRHEPRGDTGYRHEPVGRQCRQRPLLRARPRALQRRLQRTVERGRSADWLYGGAARADRRRRSGHRLHHQCRMAGVNRSDRVPARSRIGERSVGYRQSLADQHVVCDQCAATQVPTCAFAPGTAAVWARLQTKSWPLLVVRRRRQSPRPRQRPPPPCANARPHARPHACTDASTDAGPHACANASPDASPDAGANAGPRASSNTRSSTRTRARPCAGRLDFRHRRPGRSRHVLSSHARQVGGRRR